MALFESGAILLYLAAKTGKFLSKSDRLKFQVLQWLMLLMGGVAARPAVQRSVKVLADLRRPITDAKARNILFGSKQYQKR